MMSLRSLRRRLDDTSLLTKLLLPLFLSFVAFSVSAMVLWRQVELNLDALTEVSAKTLVGNAEISEIVDHIDNLNGQLYQHLSQMLANQEPANPELIKDLATDFQNTVTQLRGYERDYADPETSEEIAKALEDLRIYGEAIGFVNNMLEVDVRAAVSFIQPFDQNYRSLRTHLATLLRNAVTRSLRIVEQRRTEAYEKRFELSVSIALGTVVIFGLGLLTILATRRSIQTIAEATLDVANGRSGQDLVGLSRRDELGAIVSSLEVFQANRRELDSYREELEQLVSQRTFALEQSNVELTYTLEALKNAQDELIEQGKFASLGGMVAGIAHEVNTPLGICITGASMLQDRLKEVTEAYAEGRLNEQMFARYLKDSKDVSDLINSNLSRAAGLIRSFKQIAADQSLEEAREIELGAYVQDIITNLQVELKKHGHTVTVDLDEPILITLQPSAMWQILSNLIMNSIVHGYGPERRGKLRISLEAEERFVRVVYSDDGTGMPESVREKIFEPFFTTKRGAGGTGLGMSIVYNLVKNVLNATIACESAPGQGATFVIDIPRR